VYLDGLGRTGLSTEVIPRLETMNEKLAVLGWRCVGVRGFVPPGVFTELQARGVLAIAADIRSAHSLRYTPAPDIVHESAGHAPILADQAYAAWLRACGEVGFKAIASAEDRALFEAIRALSVVKEDPAATPDDLAHAERRLEAASRSVRYVSESTKASRLYWWTAEYGLVGSLAAPRLYGAGLLSSIGEAEHCLTPEVRRVPLSAACVDVSYDITRMQPQLFVARDFGHLTEVLGDFRRTLAWVRGGDYGLAEALRSRAVNHLVLRQRGGETLELTGELRAVHREGRDTGPDLTATVLELSGPTMVSRDARCLEKPRRIDAVVLIGGERLPARGPFSLRLASGVEATGFVVQGHEVVDLHVWAHGRQLPVPTWALVAVAEAIPSVAGGPGDPAQWDEYFGALDAFSGGAGEAVARQHKAEDLPPGLAAHYAEVRRMREGGTLDRPRLQALLGLAAGEPLLEEEVRELLEGTLAA
jgi:phenylalanine-4-hydroxylase